MIDIVFPEQNEEKFIEMAERLGYASLCFFYKELKPAYKTHIEHLQKKTKIRLYTASSISKNINPDIIVVKTADARQWLENRKTDLVYGVESSSERDSITQTKSGLNHILCSIAKEKGKIIGFDFSSILQAAGNKRTVIIARIMQNIRLCRKYRVETAIASFAHSPMHMRNPYDLKALFSFLGMDGAGINQSFFSAEDRIKLSMKKRGKGYIGEGIERI